MVATADETRMEIKKSHAADLNRQRTTGFLLGLVVAFATLFVALEYTTNDDVGTNEAALDDLTEDMDMELMPSLPPSEMIAIAPAQPLSSIPEKLNVVNEATEEEPTSMEMQQPSENESEVMDGAHIEEETTTALTPANAANADNPLNFQIVEEVPEFPGGPVEFMKWLTKNLTYPEHARQQKVQGQVVVSFIVNKDGTVANAQVVRSVNPFLDREALRVMRMMPNWKPGNDHGKPCRTLVCIPIVFKL